MKPSILQGPGQLRYHSPVRPMTLYPDMHSMPRSVSLTVCGIAAAVLLVASAACGGREADEPAVATPSLTTSHDKVPIGSPVKMTYRFEVLPNAPFDGD